MKMHNEIWPSRGVSTFRETRLAVGRLGERVGYAPVQPTAKRQYREIRSNREGLLTKDSYRKHQNNVYEEKLILISRDSSGELGRATWKSPRFDADAYRKLTDVN